MTSVRWVLIWAAAAAVAIVAWRSLWFLTDDAFIAFRYVSNHVDGLGYVWNPPPFRPVEGYTSFLWLVLLDGAWRLFGVEPMRAANLLSLGASLATLAVVLMAAARMKLSAANQSLRLPLAAMIVTGVCANRTFLVWTTSGMEAALFSAAFAAWLVVCLGHERHHPRSLALLSTLAALSALTRPEGWLAVLGTGALIVHARSRGALWAALPLVLPLAHLLWRRAFYGAWVPNTFLAKQVAPWPGLGLRYLALFVLENGLLPWLCVMIACLRVIKRPGATRLVAAVVVGGHSVYYVLAAGGDLFEFRAFCHLIPLVFLAWVGALDRLGVGRRALLAGTGAFVLWTLPVQWLAFAADWPSRARPDEQAAHIAPRMPPGLGWYGALYDRLQESLTQRGACLRYGFLRDYWLGRVQKLPPRSVGEQISRDGFPVRVGHAIGYLGWVLPNVAILDQFGLTDRVVARTPTTQRYLAHDRQPPPGYFDCFDPNVEVAPDRVTVRPRDPPMTAARIEACEANWWR